MKKIRKILNASVMVMTIAFMCGFGMLTPNFAQAAASAGDLIKMEGNSSVYYFDGEKRYVFPNENTYFSWYSDFSGVVTIPASELQSYLLGGNVVMRPGTKLVKITTDPSVYAVEPNGVLRKIQSEAQAATLFGTDWAKRVVDVPDAFFTNYTIGSALGSGEVPAGSLVKASDSASVYYFDGSSYRAIATEAAMNYNRFSFNNVITVSGPITATGNAITGMEEALVKTSQGTTTTGPVVTGSGLMVSLNATTPVAQNIPEGSNVEFLKVNLTAASDGPVNVSSIKLSAYGLSDASKIQDVSFYDAGVKVGTTRNISSNDRNATFNFATPIHVAAGTTKTLTVKAKVATNSGSYGLGVAAAADIVSSGATISGSFPVAGNLMSAVSGSAVGSIDITTATSIDHSASFGEGDVLLADFYVEAGSEENALLQTMRLYNYGTRDAGIVSNLQLFIDGDKVANGTYADRYATFNLGNYEIEKSDRVLVEVKGDIGITGAKDTIELDFRNVSDITAVGKTHGFALSVTKAALASKVTLTAGEFTISMDKVASPAIDVKPGDKGVVLATLSLKSNGEDATLLGINGDHFYISQSNTASNTVENVRMVEVGGGTYDFASVTTDNGGNYPLSLEEEIFLTKGVAKTFQVRADIKNGTQDGETLRVFLKEAAFSNNIEGEVSGAAISDITPGEVSSSIVTVKEASLDVNPTILTNVNVVAGSTNVLVYSAKVKAGTADDIRIQSVRIASTSGEAFVDANISNIALYLDGKEMKSATRITDGAVTFSSLANNIVPAGKEVIMEVKANFASSNLTSGNFELGTTAVTARSVVGSKVVSVTPVATASRLVTIADKGTLKVELLVSDSKANKNSLLLAGSQTEAGRYLGEIKFTTENEEISVEKLLLTASSSLTDRVEAQDVKAVKLVKADGTVVAQSGLDTNGNVEFDSFNITFDADKSTSLFIVVEANGIDVAGDPTSTARQGKKAAFTIAASSSVEAKGLSTGEDIVVNDSVGTHSNVATIVASKLNTISNSLSDGKLLAGNNRTIAKYTLVFDNGSNGTTGDELKATMTAFTVDVASSSASSTGFRLYVEGNSSDYATGGYDDGVVTWANLDNLGELDGTVTLVVSANVSNVAERGWIQTSITLDKADVVKYSVDGVEVDAFAHLPVTEVQGAYLAD